MDINSDVNGLSGLLAGLVFLAGLLFGLLVGAGVMLLLAPQSGKKTRRQIRRKGRELLAQTTGAIEDGVTQIRAKAHQVTTSIHGQTEAAQQRDEAAPPPSEALMVWADEGGATI